MKAFITVFGKDRPGIIAETSGLLARHKVNVEDISQTIMQGNFAMIMFVSLDGADVSLADLAEECSALAEKTGTEIFVRQEDVYRAMHRV